MLELQVLAGGTVVGQHRFATTMVGQDWGLVKVACPNGGLVHAYFKIRGMEFLEGPSAPPVTASELECSYMIRHQPFFDKF